MSTSSATRLAKRLVSWPPWNDWPQVMSERGRSQGHVAPRGPRRVVRRLTVRRMPPAGRPAMTRTPGGARWRLGATAGIGGSLSSGRRTGADLWVRGFRGQAVRSQRSAEIAAESSYGSARWRFGCSAARSALRWPTRRPGMTKGGWKGIPFHPPFVIGTGAARSDRAIHRWRFSDERADRGSRSAGRSAGRQPRQPAS